MKKKTIGERKLLVKKKQEKLEIEKIIAEVKELTLEEFEDYFKKPGNAQKAVWVIFKKIGG